MIDLISVGFPLNNVCVDTFTVVSCSGVLMTWPIVEQDAASRVNRRNARMSEAVGGVDVFRMVISPIGDLDDGRFPEQVHVADFHPLDLLPDPFAEVLPQFLPAAFLKEFNPVIHHPLGHEVLHEKQPLENEGDGPQEPIAHGHIEQIHGHWSQSVHHGHGNDQEQIGHLPDGHRIGPVPDDAENGKQPESESEIEFHPTQHPTQQEHRGAHHGEGEHEVPALGLGLVDHPDDDPAGNQVGCEMQGDLGHVRFRLAGPRPRTARPVASGRSQGTRARRCRGPGPVGPWCTCSCAWTVRWPLSGP